MTKPEIKNLLLKCLETRCIPSDIPSSQLHALNYAYAKMIHGVLRILDECINKCPSKLLDMLHAQPEEMLDQFEEDKFVVAHALLIRGPFTVQRFQSEPLEVLSEVCCLKPHTLPKTGVYIDVRPSLDNLLSANESGREAPVPSWLDMSWESFVMATPEMQKSRYSILHSYRMEARLMALHDKDRGVA